MRRARAAGVVPVESAWTATAVKLLSPVVVAPAFRFVSGIGAESGDSVQASGEPVHVKEALWVKFEVVTGQAETDMVRLAPVMLQALPDTEVWVCVGELIAGALALDPPALANVQLSWLVALVHVIADETEHPRLMQFIGSSGLQSPPFCERMCARSPDPT